MLPPTSLVLANGLRHDAQSCADGGANQDRDAHQSPCYEALAVVVDALRLRTKHQRHRAHVAVREAEDDLHHIAVRLARDIVVRVQQQKRHKDGAREGRRYEDPALLVRPRPHKL
ncbi:nucleoside transporter 1, putative [Leishmania tarentolae]|uniref:Nucleoside transporter 1, putative n=1 Tax=Leishmania tarentolae TaxID=5689 RepID=A0A640KDD6_LEITA|nr:nucleoside transporter 1, putative [Leishmania tarentolae]